MYRILLALKMSQWELKTAFQLVISQYNVFLLSFSFKSSQLCVVLMHRIPKIRGFVRESLCVTSPSHILPSWRRKRWQARRWRWRVSGCRARHSTIIRWYLTLERSRICFSVAAATSATQPTTRSAELSPDDSRWCSMFLTTHAKKNIWIWQYL